MTDINFFPFGEPGNRTKICVTIDPPMINSNGILHNTNSPANFLKYSLPLLELQIALIVIITHTLYFFLKRYGITTFICQILAGLILGPTFLGRFDFMREVVFPRDSQIIICTIAYFGYGFYMFLSGVKIEIGPTLKSTGRVVIIAGAASVLGPFLFGYGLILPYIAELKEKKAFEETMQVIIVNCFSTMSIVIHVLEELKLMNSELGLLALSAAVCADGVGVVFATVHTLLQQKLSSTSTMIDMSAFVVFMLVTMCIIRPVILHIIKKTPQGSFVDSSIIYIIPAMAFVSAIYFHLFHQLQSLGALIFGLIIPAGPPLGSALIDKFESFTEGVLVPLAVATSAMRADLTLVITNFGDLKFYMSIIFLIFAAKLLACLLPSMYCDMPFIDSLLFSVIMTSRGIIELSLYLLLRDTLMISEQVFALLVLNMLINSTFVAIIVKCLYEPSRKYAGYRARNIMSLKPKFELRILACVHKPDNITSIIKLIDAFHPDKERFICLYVLHIIQLIGRTTPLLISHQKQKPISDSRCHNVIVSFSHYEQNNWDNLSVSTFTALSPSKSTNEDITRLALDKLTSLILLPLHRRWSIHGSIEAEDKSIRNINCRVLETAPCSVGIFFDRGKLGHVASAASPKKTNHSICMIFLGGNDDREALSLAKRIARDSDTRLTVVHFVPEYVELSDSDDLTLDTWALEEIKQLISSKESPSNIVYKELMVKDGPDAAFAIRSIADDYDLFLVGRRYGIESPQTAGLSEWTELPELGVIGDMFASKYLSTRAAVLVVQQQKQVKKRDRVAKSMHMH